MTLYILHPTPETSLLYTQTKYTGCDPTFNECRSDDISPTCYVITGRQRWYHSIRGGCRHTPCCAQGEDVVICLFVFLHMFSINKCDTLTYVCFAI